MKTIKVMLDFSRMTVPERIEFGRNTVIKMTGNTNFSNPFVPLPQLTTGVNDLETKYNLAQNGGKQQKADMRQADKALIALLRKQAFYVENVATGNESVILSSGFHASRQPMAVTRAAFAVESGDSPGEVYVVHKAIKRASAYIWQHCSDALPADENNWDYAGITTRHDFIMSGLVTGSKHWFRVAWLTKEGLSAWSDPLMKIVV